MILVGLIEDEESYIISVFFTVLRKKWGILERWENDENLNLRYSNRGFSSVKPKKKKKWSEKFPLRGKGVDRGTCRSALQPLSCVSSDFLSFWTLVQRDSLHDPLRTDIGSASELNVLSKTFHF